jgi:hypothetical protein
LFWLVVRSQRRRSHRKTTNRQQRRDDGVVGWLVAFKKKRTAMSGTRITDQQVGLYMSKRKHHSQEVAAAKAGISSRTADSMRRTLE